MKLLRSWTKKKEENKDSLIIRYRGANWRYYELDISPAALEPYGFNYGDRVDTPAGSGTVIGVRKDKLWFHFDRNAGASYWDAIKNHRDLKRAGISLLETEKNGFYKLQKINFQNRQVNVIVQGDDTPFPLIPIVNLLALRRDITIGHRLTINTSYIITLLSNYLISRCANESEEVIEQVTKAVEQLSHGEVNIDVCFSSPASVEKNDQHTLFSVLGVRLFHCWVVDPLDNEVFKVVANKTYKELKDLVDPKNSPTHPSHEGDIIEDFLKSNSSEITPYGYDAMLNSLSDGELCIFYNKSKFFTVLRNNDRLFGLVSNNIINSGQLVKFPNFHWEHFQVYPAMIDHTELPSIEITPTQGSEPLKTNLDCYDDTNVSIRCFSTFPSSTSASSSSTSSSSSPDEPNPNSIYFSSYPNRKLGVMVQGCPKKAMQEALMAIEAYLEDKREKIRDLRDAGHFLLRSFAEAFQIITKANEVGDYNIMAVMSLQLKQKNPSDPQWGVLCANVGNCKAFLAKSNGKVEDITHGSWITGHWPIPGGFYKKWVPDFNLRLYFKPCQKEDMVLMMSSTMHENLDPVVLGKMMQPPLHLILPLATYKSDHVCSMLSDMVASANSFSPSGLTDNLMDHCMSVTQTARYLRRLLGRTSKSRTGHMGCVSLVAFHASHKFTLQSSPPTLNAQGQLVVDSPVLESSNGNLAVLCSMVIKAIIESSHCTRLTHDTVECLSLVCADIRKVVQPLMQKKFTFRAIEGRKLFSFSPQRMITDSTSDLPSTLTHLTFSHSFNQPIPSNLPSSLIFLSFGHRFNQPIQRLPPALLHLTFGNSFNYPLNNIPASLTHLHFGADFKGSISSLPPSLLSLSLGECFEGPITHLPPSLMFLKVNNLACKIQYLPPSITHLTCADYSSAISLSSSLTHLTLGNEFNQQIDRFPPSLTHLTFGDSFDRLFDPPPLLTHLTMGGRYNHIFADLPPSLTHLVLGDDFNMPLYNLPPSLTHLTLGYNFDQLLNHLPPSLTHVIVRNQSLLHYKYSLPHITFVYSLKKQIT